jgi:hypothetical protein
MTPPVLISSLAPLKATAELYSIKKHAERFEFIYLHHYLFAAALCFHRSFCQSTAINILLFHRPPGCTLGGRDLFHPARVNNVIRQGKLNYGAHHNISHRKMRCVHRE